MEKEPDLKEYFYKRFLNKKEITIEDLKEMKESGISLESYLEYLKEKYNYLFHGSRNDISSEDGIKGDVIFSSSNPAVAILKALYLNNAKNLGYPMNLERDNSNMVLTISEPRSDTIGNQGFVYVLDSVSFDKDSSSNWQHTAKEQEVPFIQKIEVTADDFKYPVEIN
jgi:hypothetical protein